MTAGFSQGCIVAAQIAQRANFNVTQVLTAGAPGARILEEMPVGVNVVSLEQPRDPIPTLDGRPNPERPEMMTYRLDQDALYCRESETAISHDVIRYAKLAEGLDGEDEAMRSMAKFFSSSVQDQTRFGGGGGGGGGETTVKPFGVVRKSLLASVLSITLLAVGGCAGIKRGQSLEQATEAIRKMEGLSGEATSGGYYSGWVYDRWSSAEVTLESGFEIADHRGLALWLVQTAWSLNEDRPNQGVSISIRFADRGEFERWKAAEDSLDLPTQVALGDSDLGNVPSVTIRVPDWFTKDAGLGPWPGEVPAFPENAIKKAADE